MGFSQILTIRKGQWMILQSNFGSFNGPLKIRRQTDFWFKTLKFLDENLCLDLPLEFNAISVCPWKILRAFQSVLPMAKKDKLTLSLHQVLILNTIRGINSNQHKTGLIFLPLWSRFMPLKLLDLDSLPPFWILRACPFLQFDKVLGVLILIWIE